MQGEKVICGFSKKRGLTIYNCVESSEPEVQLFERGSILGPSAEVQRSTKLESSMSDARFLKRDGRWSMHGRVRIVDGRCTVEFGWSMVDAR